MVIGIIGAGASGMMAAITAAENPYNHILLFERQARVGKKLSATGNGRCNLTNTAAEAQGYHGDDPDFAYHAVCGFDLCDTLHFFSELGLYTVTEPGGRVYPYSDQANSVVDVLRFALNKPNIRLMTACEVTRVRRGEDFTLEYDGGSIHCDRLIIACGGLAGTKLGGSMAGYKLLRSLGHKITKLRPSLVQLRTGWKGVSALKGVRANCHVQILQDGKVFAESTGVLQFTELGLSGPVMFEVSRDACQGSGSWEAKLDFLPNWDENRIVSMLRKRQSSELTCEELLTGILHNRLGRVLTQETGLSLSRAVSNLSEEQLAAVANLCKNFTVSLTEPLGMDSAQVTAGGAVTAEFDPISLESKLVPGLFACGEVLDVDGDCGGYNLQWAWSSGYMAGIHAGGEP